LQVDTKLNFTEHTFNSQPEVKSEKLYLTIKLIEFRLNGLIDVHKKGLKEQFFRRSTGNFDCVRKVKGH